MCCPQTAFCTVTALCVWAHIVLSLWATAKNEKERLCCTEKSLTNCPLLDLNNLSWKSATLLPLADFDLRTIPRRFSREEKTELLFYILTIDITTGKLWKCDFTADKSQTEQKEKKIQTLTSVFENFALISGWNRLTQKRQIKQKQTLITTRKKRKPVSGKCKKI
jgi:hypothetical protein